MSRRIFLALAGILAALLVAPPLWYAVFPAPSAAGFPPPGRRVEVAPGIRVNLLEAGFGPPVVLVHGHPGSAYDWRGVMAQLAERGHRVLAYDRVGYGHSDGREGPSLVATNAGELLALLAAEDLRDVTLVGFSYGGGTAIAAAHRDSSRLAGLVLVGSVGPGIENRPGPPAWVAELLVGPVLSWLAAVPPAFARFGDAFIRIAFEPEPVDEDYRALSSANFAMPHTFETFRNEGRDLDGRADIDPSGLTLPILVVQGDGDQLVPAAVGRSLNALAPQSEIWMIESAGHMIPVTRSAALADRIAAFAQRPPSPRAGF